MASLSIQKRFICNKIESRKADSPPKSFILLQISSRNPYLCRPFTSSGDGARLIEKYINNICKRKNIQQCPEKKEPTNPIHAVENRYMDFVSVCRMPMAERFWPAEEQRDVTNWPFLMNTVQKNRTRFPYHSIQWGKTYFSLCFCKGYFDFKDRSGFSFGNSIPGTPFGKMGIEGS